MCVYSVTGKNSVNETGEESHGLLCFAEIEEFSGKLDSEIEKVELMDELPENWTYPLIQPILLEKFWQMEKQSYTKIQLAAKKTIEYIQSIIKPGMNLLEIRRLCEDKLLELGADSFWYWDVGAFVFAGDETTVSVSGKQYVTSDSLGEDDFGFVIKQEEYIKFAQEKYSNGETSMQYFEEYLQPNALYLLDEPEVSLSPSNQVLLANEINKLARLLECQFVIATHSPFMLGTLNAKIYNIDTKEYDVVKWNELENVQYFYNFFKKHEQEFEEVIHESGE